MAAPLGNKNGAKLKTAELREMAYKQYCDWVAAGNSKDSWFFKHPEITFTKRQMENLMKENPVEFPPSQMELALASSQRYWEEVGQKMMMGEIEKCQPAIWQIFMRNKFGWDKKEEKDNSIDINLLDKFLERLSSLSKKES